MQTDIKDTADQQLSLKQSPSALIEIGSRIALVLVAALAGSLSAWVAVPATAIAVVVVAEWAVRRRRRGFVDAVLSGVAGTIVGTVLIGLLLNLLPVGLTQRSWVIAGAVIGVIVIALGAVRPIPPSVWQQHRALGADAADSDAADSATADVVKPQTWSAATTVNAVCAFAAVLVITAALIISVNSAAATRVAPLEISATAVGTGVEVTINTGAAAGPFDLLMVSGSSVVPVASNLQVDETTSIVVVVSIPPTGRTLLQLVPSGSTDPLRELIFDFGVLTSVAPS